VAVAACGAGDGTAESTTTSSTTTTIADEVSLLRDDGPERVLAALQGRFGREVQLFSLSIHETHASMRVRDPKIPDNVDDYVLRDGVIGDQRPVHTSVHDDLDAQVFSLRAVRWDLLSGLVDKAETDLKIEDARASHISISRVDGADGRGAAQIAIYVSGPRRSGALQAEGDGTIISIEQS
jgi:hypothetical protein